MQKVISLVLMGIKGLKIDFFKSLLLPLGYSPNIKNKLSYFIFFFFM